MKGLYPLLVALLPTTAAQAQQLQGYFLSTTKAFTSDLLFFEGNQFHYNQSTCTGLTKGKGTFSIQRDTLKLHFSNSVNPLAMVVPCREQISRGLAIQVFDSLDNEPLTGVTVYVKSAKPTTRQVGAFTNNTGEVKLDYTPATADSLVIAYVGYVTQRLSLINSGSNCLKITLTHTTYVAAGTTYCFPLESLRQNSFTTHLTANAQSSYAHFHYKRITANKAQGILKAREQRQ